MSDLHAIQNEPPPRSEALCGRVARQLSPLWGFLAYGILYLFLVSNTVWVLSLIGGFYLAYEVFRFEDGSVGLRTIVLSLGTIGMVATWIPFVRWARRKRARLRTLVREGALMDARMSGVFPGYKTTHITLEIPLDRGSRKQKLVLAGRIEGLEIGSTVPVLCHPDSRVFAAFPLGYAVAARWR